MKRLICLVIIGALVVPIFPSEAQLATFPANLMQSSSSLSSPANSALMKVSIADDYVLGPGDKMDAHLVVGENAMVLDYSLIINPEGLIYFDNIGNVALSGLTLKQARAKINKAIKNIYKERFDLLLTVSEPKLINIYITGQIDQPGLYMAYDGTRIADILKLVGVAKGGSDLSEYVYVKRNDSKGEFREERFKLLDLFAERDGKQNILLKNGDIISVPSIKSYVYIYGEVSRSGTYGYVPGQSLSDYINIAGGPTSRASLGSVTITRIESGKPKVFKVDVSEIMQRGIKNNDLEIYAGDVISVPGNFFYFSDFASFANTILLALTLYNTVKK